MPRGQGDPQARCLVLDFRRVGGEPFPVLPLAVEEGTTILLLVLGLLRVLLVGLTLTDDEAGSYRPSGESQDRDLRPGPASPVALRSAHRSTPSHAALRKAHE